MKSSEMATPNARFGPGSSIQRSGFRWVVLIMVCLLHFINFADRANIGVAIPALRGEFHISNFELGQMASIFFLGYFIVQIPAGWLVSKYGVRGLITSTIIAFSAFTALIGASVSTAMVKWSRFGLGICEAPTVVATNGSVKTWFPSKERGLALGFLTGLTSLSVAVAPIASSWILKTWGWRYIFYCFAIPGIIFSVFWYVLIRRFPQDSPHVNAAEVEYIQTAVPTRGRKTAALGALGGFDKFLRSKRVAVLESNAKIFTSRNIWGVALVYLFIQIIFYGIATWVPSYLLNAKHYSIMRMGWVSATPWVGAVVGNLMGGWINDKFLYGRCKPMMMVSGLGTVLGMWSIVAATTPTGLGIAMFVTGIFANCGWASYFGFPMAFTSAKTYPVAISVMIMGGNIGAFLSPMSLGWLLDRYKGDYNVIFIAMGVAALLSLLSAMIIIDEPVNV